MLHSTHRYLEVKLHIHVLSEPAGVIVAESLGISKGLGVDGNVREAWHFLLLLPFPEMPSPPAQGCSAAAGHAPHHPAQGPGTSLHRTVAISWWPLSCLPHSLRKSSLPGPAAQFAALGTQCQPLQTWGRGLSGSSQGGKPLQGRPPQLRMGAGFTITWKSDRVTPGGVLARWNTLA